MMEDFFKFIAVTIIAGLMFATLLTMVVVPVRYTTYYKDGAA